MRIDISSAHIENLRGYRSCSIALQKARTVLVGPNNAGKTSVLKLVDWLLNKADLSLLRTNIEPPHDVLEFLLPARTARHRARRLTLELLVSDARSHRRYKCEKGVAQLRLNLRNSPSWRLYLALGAPYRGETTESESMAIDLLERLRNDMDFLYIPSFRDGASPRFSETLLHALRTQLGKRALHHARAGAPAEYRRVKKALDEIRTVAEELASPLWTNMHEHLPPGLAQKAKITLEVDSPDLIDWASERLSFRLSTGTHDNGTVDITDVGSGLQSLLDFAIHRSSTIDGDKSRTLVIEEPESFLHPSAQRSFARRLLSASNIDKTIITTHSPIVVEEAAYSDIILCREQNFYEPAPVTDNQREEINTALLTGYGSEMVFARSVLLVEGESDRLFFEHLRRRLASLDVSGKVDELFVVPVGGKAQFAPWIRLLESYVYRGDRPIRWLAVADGDAASQLRQAFNDAQISISRKVIQEIGRVGSEKDQGNERWRLAIKRLNTATRSDKVAFLLLPVDLEDAILSNASPETLQIIAEKISSADLTCEGLLNSLGSKAANNGAGNSIKHPWVRAFIAKTLPWNEVSDDVLAVLKRWLEGAMSPRKVGLLLKKTS